MFRCTLLALCSAVIIARVCCSSCSSPWAKVPGIEGSCFLFSKDLPTSHPDLDTWTNANAICQRFPGGNLASIDSKATNDALYNYWLTKEPNDIFRTIGPYWIGLRMSTGTTQWTDGTPLGYTNWVPGEPVHSCAHIIESQSLNSEEPQQWGY